MKLLNSIIILFHLAIHNCNGQTPNKESIDVPPPIIKLGASDGEYDVSLIKLISNPEKYDGKTIQVIGYLNLEFEGNAIYLHKEDYENGLTKNGFWVDFSREIQSRKTLNDYSKRYVIIVGTFKMKDQGHMGLFGGTLENIDRLDIWK
jgi:hypothetical protein